MYGRNTQCATTHGLLAGKVTLLKRTDESNFTIYSTGYDGGGEKRCVAEQRSRKLSFWVKLSMIFHSVYCTVKYLDSVQTVLSLNHEKVWSNYYLSLCLSITSTITIDITINSDINLIINFTINNFNINIRLQILSV